MTKRVLPLLLIVTIALFSFGFVDSFGMVSNESADTIGTTNVEILNKVDEGRDVNKGGWRVVPDYDAQGRIIQIAVRDSNLGTVETFVVTYNDDGTYGITKTTETSGEYNASIKVCFNGRRVMFDVAPVTVDGRILVPMHNIFDMLGYTLNWNEVKQRIVAVKGDSAIQLDIGDTIAILDDYYKALELDVPPQIIDGRTMIPLRFVAEASNYDVIWDENTNTAHIETIFDGDIMPRPYQAVAMLDDTMIWTDGFQIFHDGRIFNEAEFTNSNSLQINDGFMYYRDVDLNLCRANIDTNETEMVLAFPVANILVSDDKLFYSKVNDSTHALFRSNLDGSEEVCVVADPCGDYRVLKGWIFYIHLTNRSLKRMNMITGETTTIYNGFTACFDVYHDNYGGMVYYCMAEYTDETTPLIYKGVKCYNLNSEWHELGKMLQGISMDNMWVLGNNLFYQSLSADGKTDLYRYSLKYGYNVKILGDVLGGTEIHGKRIFYYPAENDYPYMLGAESEPVLYIANTRGANGFPVKSFVFSAISVYGIDGNMPDESVFDEFLSRDIANYVLDKFGTTKFDFTLLSKNPEGDMNGGCAFYIWVNTYSDDGAILEVGVVRARAENRERFLLGSIYSKEDIVTGKVDVNTFPKVMRKRILELAGSFGRSAF